MSNVWNSVRGWRRRSLREWSEFILIHGFFPITYPIIYADRRYANWKYYGHPPLVPLGHKLSDYVDKLFVHPIQRRRAQRHVHAIDRSLLPVELAQIIVDMCRVDVQTLKALSLVSPTWMTLTRAYLPQNVELSRHEAYNFITILRSPLRTISRIQRVHIKDERRWRLVPGLLKELARVGVVVDFLDLDLDKNRSLEIRDHSELTPIHAKRLSVRCQPWAQELINEVIDLACSFPDLDALSIQATMKEGEHSYPSRMPYATPTSDIHLPFKLKRLSLALHSPLRLAKWLLDTNAYAMRNLVTLDMFSNPLDDEDRPDYDIRLDEFFPTLEMLGPQLKHLGITVKHRNNPLRGFTPWYTQKRTGGPLLTSLKSITFAHCAYNNFGPIDAAADIIAILATLKRESAYLTDVIFRANRKMYMFAEEATSLLNTPGWQFEVIRPTLSMDSLEPPLQMIDSSSEYTDESEAGMNHEYWKELHAGPPLYLERYSRVFRAP